MPSATNWHHKQTAALRTFRETTPVVVSFTTVGRSRAALAEKIARELRAETGGAEVTPVPGRYDRHLVTAGGLTWVVQRADPEAPEALEAEVISPPLTLDACAPAGALLARVVDAVGRAGARVDASCRLRVAVSARAMNAVQVACLAVLVHNHEEVLFDALGVPEHARMTDRAPFPASLARTLRSAALAAPRGAPLDALRDAWEAAPASRGAYAFSLAGLFLRGAVEFRHCPLRARPNGAPDHASVRAAVLFALGYTARGARAGAPGMVGSMRADRYRGASPAAQRRAALADYVGKAVPGAEYAADRALLRGA